MNPAALLLDPAPVAIVGDVLRRLGGATRVTLLGQGAAPGEAVTAYTLAHGDDADRAALAANRTASPELLLRLADGASATVAVNLFCNQAAPREVKLGVLAATTAAMPVERLLYEVPGHRHIVERTSLRQRAYVLVESDDPRTVTAAFDTLVALDDRPPWLPAVVLRGCVNLLRTAGRVAVESAFPRIASLLDAHQPDVVAAALAEPTDPARLNRALDHLESMPVILTRLREATHVPAVTWMLLAPRVPLDWDAIVRAHRDRPLGRYTLAGLTAQLACPAELQTRLPPGSPYNRTIRAWIDPDAATDRLLRIVAPLYASNFNTRVRTAHAGGALSAATILGHGAPARGALRTFERATGPHLEDARQAVRALTDVTLAEHTEAWVVALKLLPDFAGTLPELLTTAAAVAAPSSNGGQASRPRNPTPRHRP
jgi:hypothetical protein